MYDLKIDGLLTIMIEFFLPRGRPFENVVMAQVFQFPKTFI